VAGGGPDDRILVMTCARILSLIVALLALVQAGCGLFLSGVYRDNAWITSAFRGNDFVTAIMAVPMLLAATHLARRGGIRAMLVWLGSLFYMVYNYAFYLFGAELNRFILVYAALIGLSLAALFLVGVNAQLEKRAFPCIAPRWVAGFMLLFTTLMASVWIHDWLRFATTGVTPQLGGSALYHRAVAAVDLTFQVPFLVAAIVWLWQRKPWGQVIGAVCMIADAVYMVVLAVFSPFAAAAGVPGAWDHQTPMWVALAAGCAVSSFLLLRPKRA
jgi:hypothetical protein